MRLEEVLLAIRAYARVPRFIRQHKLWAYLIVPGIIHLCMLVGMFFVAREIGGEVAQYLMDWMQQPENSWQKALAWILGFGVKMLLFFLYFLIYKSLILIIMTPLLALLSEKVDSIVTGNDYPFSWTQLMKDIWRGIGIAMRCLFYELMLLLVVSMFTWVFAPILAFFISAYFWGVAMVDFNSERKRFNIKQSFAYIRRHRGLALGNGIVFYGMFLIPVLGWMVAPTFGIIAATLAVLESDKAHA